MQIRGTNQRTALNSNQGIARLQWLVRKLSRREGGALALPLSLAVLAVANARERDQDEDLHDDADQSGAGAADAQAPLLKGGERIVLMAGDTVLLEHLLTDAEVAAGRVRVAMHRIEGAHAAGVRFEAADQAGSAMVEDIEAVADAAAEANVQAEGSAAPGEEGDSQPLAQSSGEATEAAAAAASAGSDAAAIQEDDDDHGLMWLVLGIGAAGAGLVIAHDDKNDSPPQLNTISGQVVKGYVEGAAVYLDIDGDGLPDGDPVYTDAEGRFTLQTSHQGASIVVYGGVDTLTNVPFDGLVLRAPAGSTVVTPITTLLDAMLRQDPSLDVATAQSRLLDALGVSLPAGTDLRTYDPVAGVTANGGELEDQSEAVLNTIAAIQSILTGAGAAGDLAAADAAINALARAVLDAGSLDLTSAEDVQAVLQEAFADTGVGASDPEDLAALAGAIASVNGALNAASGLGEEALQVTRYAFSSFQDLLSSIGATAHSTDEYERDISFSSDSGIADAVNAINGGGLGEVIAGHSSLSISFAERLEGGRFALALNPELKFHNGAPDTIDTVAIRFDEKGVLVQMETRGANGQVVVQTLVPDEEGYYHLAYGNLDKIFFQTATEYNGQLGIDVRVHYVGLGITVAPPTQYVPIESVNDAPASSHASVQATEDQAYVFSIGDFPFTDARDAASASGANQLGAVRIVSLPVHGTLFLGEHPIDSADLASGYFVSAEDIASGRLRYLPGADDNGDAYASFQFQVRDNGGTARGGVDLDPAIHTLTVDVAPVSDAPVAIRGEVSLAEDGTRAFTSADFGFTDIDGDTLAGILIVSLPVEGTLYFDGEAIDGGLLGEEGLAISAAQIALLTWTPPADYNGSASFQYQVRDSGAEGANLSNVTTMDINVTAVSDAPVAGENSATLDEDATRTFSAGDFAFTDIDGDSLDAVLITSLPTSGELRFDGVSLGEEDVEGEGFFIKTVDLGRLTYVPEQDSHGGDSFSYRLRDTGIDGEGESLSAEADFALSVTPVSDQPTSTPVPVTIDEDGAHTFEASDFGFADVDGDSLTALVIKTLPEDGVLVFDGTTLQSSDVAEGGLVIAASDIGLLQFVPDADFNGTASFMFRLQDGGSEEANQSIKATLEITVNAVSDAPEATGSSATLDEDGSHTFEASQFGLADVDGDGLAGVYITSLPANGVLRLNGEEVLAGDLGEAGLFIPAAGLPALEFVPAPDFNGTVSFGYRVKDEGAEGANESATAATFELLVTPVSDAPTANASPLQMAEDGTLTFCAADFGFVDVDADELSQVIITSLPANGTFRYDGAVLTEDDLLDGGFAVDVENLGLLRFEPSPDFNGEIELTYRLRDTGATGANLGEEASVTLAVQPVSDAPTASPDTLEMGEDGAINFQTADFGYNDIDGDTFVGLYVTSLPVEGTLLFTGEPLTDGDLGESGFWIASADLGNLVFTPPLDYVGTASFGFRVQDDGADGLSLGAPATLQIGIHGVNDAPVVRCVTDQTITYVEGGEGVLVAPSAHLSDVELDALNGGLGDWSGASISIGRSEGDHGHHAAREDRFGFSSATEGLRFENGQIIRSVEDVDHVIGSYHQWHGRIQIRFSSSTEEGAAVPTSADVQQVLRSVTYLNRSDNPQESVTLAVTVRDGNDGAQGGEEVGREMAQITIGLVNVNDAPQAWRNHAHIDEDQLYTFNAPDFRFRDAEGDELQTLIITGLPESGALYYCGEPLTVDDLCDGGLRIAAADIGNLSFRPDTNFHGNVQFTYRLQDDGGTEHEGLDTSNEATFRVSVRSVNDAPEFLIPGTSGSATPDSSCEPSILVNTTLEGSQEAPRIAALADGGYVVVWTSRMDGEEADYDVYGQRFNSAGGKVGEEFRVTESSSGYQAEPTVVALPSGGFAVLWANRSEANSDIQVRVFDADGNAGIDPITVNTHTAGNQIDPAVAGLDNGIVMVWASDQQDGSGYGIFTRVFNGSESAEIRVNTTTNFNQVQPAVATLADGSFVVTWTSHNNQGVQNLYSRRFAADGSPIDATEVAVNVQGLEDHYQSSVSALADGGYVVAWTGNSGDDSLLNDVYVQRYGADGQPVGEALLVNTQITAGEQREPAVVGLPSGGFMVTWTSWGSEDSSLDVYAQRFGADGLPLGESVLVNSTTDKEQTTPAIAVLNDGTVVVTWQSNTEHGGADYEIHAQHFQAMTPWFIEGASGNREDVVPVRIAPGATVFDVELSALNEGAGDWTGATLVLQREGGNPHGWGHGGHFSRSPDHFEFQGANGYTVDADGLLLKDGELIGRMVERNGRLTVEFGTPEGIDVSGYTTRTPTNADVNFVLQHIAYWNSSDNPGESVVLQYRMEDGNGHWFGSQGKGGEEEGWASVEVKILNVNDAPEARHNGELLLEDHSHTFDSGDFRFRDAEGDGLQSVTITSLPEGGKLLYCGRELEAGDLCGEDGGFTIAACDLDKLVFVPEENFHGQIGFTYFLRDDGGTERGGHDTSAEATFRILVAPVNDAPELDLSGYTFVVTTLEDAECDDGQLSLREALAQARDGDSIAFAANLSGGTINLNGSPLLINSSVYINGLANGDCEGITLQTTGAYPAIEVAACVTDGMGVVLSGLNIAGNSVPNVIDGPAGSAAAIINGGMLTLHEVGISGYHQLADGCNDVASVLWNREGAQLYISGLDVHGNVTSAVDNHTASLILNEGSLDLVGAVFRDNMVTSEGLEGGGAWLVYNSPDASFALTSIDAVPGQTIAPLGMGQGDYYFEADGCQVDAPTSTFSYVAPDLRPRYTEDDECAVRLMPSARVTDADLDVLNGGEGNWSGASIVIAPKGDDHSCSWGWWPGGDGSDLGLADGGNLSFVDGQILKGCGDEAVVIGTYDTNESGALVISFPRHAAESSIPTSEDVNNVLRLVTYRNTSQDPGETVTIGVTVSDGNGRFFGSQGLGGEGREVGEVTVVINAVNDAPTFDFEANPPVVVSREEDETYVFSAGDFPFVDVEGHGLGGVIIAALPASGCLAVDGRIVTLEQVGCDGFFVSAEDIACGRLTFQPAPDQHGVASFEYKVRDNGGTDHGGEDTTADIATFTFDVRSVNDAPKLALSTTADYAFVVTTLDDSCDPEDGKLSLREALAMACDGDSITFDPSLLSCGDASIVLGSTLSIDKQVYINGAIGDGHISLLRDHCMEGALIEVTCEVGSDRGGAVLQGLVLDGECVETASAALVNAGHLVLHDVTITDQNTVNDCGDAVSALLNLSGGVLVATALTVSGNSARAGEGDDAYAILNLGHLTVDGLVVNGNTQEGGDSFSGQGGDAFALFNAGLYYQGDAGFCGNTSIAGSGDDCGCDAQGPGSFGDIGGGEPAATGFALQFLAPVLTGSRPDVEIAVVADGEAVRLAPDAVLSDVELDSLRSGAGNWSGARIEVRRVGGADASDEFGQVLGDGALQVNEAGQIIKLVDDIPRVIGSFTTSGGVLAVHFTGHGSAYATTEDVNGILRSLTYRNTSSEFEGDINLQVTVRDGNAPFDGPQGAGANGGPGEGIVKGIIQVHVEQLPLATPESVVLLTDTASAGDGITGNPGDTLLFQVRFGCAEDLVVGQEIRLYRGEVELGSHVITEEDLGCLFVAVPVSTAGLDDFGFSAVTARVAANAGSSRESDASAPYFVTYDTAAPAAPVVDELQPVVTSEANPNGSLLVSGTAEAFATITVSGQMLLDGEGGTMQIGTFTTEADASGRFSLLVALSESGLEEGNFELQVVASDRAGNVSEAVTVNTSAGWQSTSWMEDEDTWSTDGFVADGEGEVVGFRFNGAHLEGRHGTEWFVAPAALASSLSLDGRSNDYTITLVEGDLRDAAIAGAPLGVEGGILADRPLYLVEFWAVDVENPSRLYLQVDTVHFSDGTSLGLSVDGVHVLDYGKDTSGTWTVQAGAGNESVSGSSGDDVLYGGDGNNLLVGGAGNDYLISYGAADHSALQPGDVLMGGEGDDILVVLGDSSTGEGPVHLYGGSGHDIFAVAPVSAADLHCYGLPQQAGFNRDVTIHDFVVGEDRIDLSWLYVSNEGEGYRRINAEDLGIDALAADLADDGRMEIDLSRFVTADGEELGGSLVVQLAGGSAELTECSFLLGEMSMLDSLREDYLADALRVVTHEPV